MDQFRNLQSYLSGRIGLNDYLNTTLQAAGLVLLADLTTVAQRTARMGTSSLLDALVLCPGLHKQQDAPTLSEGEYPACGAMTTGYVFRIENPATVFFLQRVGKPGHLTTLSVSPLNGSAESAGATNTISSITYGLSVGLTVAVLWLLVLLQDWWAVLVLSILVLVRLLNVIVVWCRKGGGWHGALEPGVSGDLIILLNQDKWIRMKGLVDDLKVVNSGEWLREPTFLQRSLINLGTLLVYFSAAIAFNAQPQGQVLLLILWGFSAGLLEIANEYTGDLHMHGKLIRVDGEPQRYMRRLDLTEQLIKESGRDDWALQLGMKRPSSDGGRKQAGSVVTM